MKKCLFDYNAEELIRNKDIVLLRLTELEIEYKKQEAELYPISENLYLFFLSL